MRAYVEAGDWGGVTWRRNQGEAGKRIWKVVPLSASLWTVMAPWCSWDDALVMEQAQAVVRLGGEERLEQARHILGVMADAVIL